MTDKKSDRKTSEIDKDIPKLVTRTDTSPIFLSALPQKTVPQILDEIVSQRMRGWGWEQFVSAGMEARALKDFSQWALGHLAFGLEKEYGEDALGKFAREIGVSSSSLNVYRWVVRKFGRKYCQSDRGYIPFELYKVAAGTEEPEGWIERAWKNDWTVNQMRREVQKLKKPAAMCEHEYETIKRCRLCGRVAPL